MAPTNQPIPTHVAIIFDDYVRVKGNATCVWQQLAEAGYTARIVTDDSGYSAIRFQPGAPHAKNISLLTLLFLLNGQRQLGEGLSSFTPVARRHSDPTSERGPHFTGIGEHDSSLARDA